MQAPPTPDRLRKYLIILFMIMIILNVAGVVQILAKVILNQGDLNLAAATIPGNTLILGAMLVLSSKLVAMRI